jgi:hypothetical protein
MRPETGTTSREAEVAAAKERLRQAEEPVESKSYMKEKQQESHDAGILTATQKVRKAAADKSHSAERWSMPVPKGSGTGRQHAGHVDRKPDGSNRALPPPSTEASVPVSSGSKGEGKGKRKLGKEPGDDSGSDSDWDAKEVPEDDTKQARRKKNASLAPDSQPNMPRDTLDREGIHLRMAIRVLQDRLIRYTGYAKKKQQMKEQRDFREEILHRAAERIDGTSPVDIDPKLLQDTISYDEALTAYVNSARLDHVYDQNSLDESRAEKIQDWMEETTQLCENLEYVFDTI